MSKRREYLAVGALLPLWGCASYFPAYPEFFEFKWIEDVQLHDGRVIPVEVTRSFQRIDRSAQYDGPVRMYTSVSFDAGPGVGRFAMKVRGNIAMVEQKDGVWYLLIETNDEPYRALPQIVMSGLRLVHLEGNRIVGNRHSRELPREFKDLNLTHLIGFAKLAQYDGRYMTLKDKEEFRKKHNPGELRIKVSPTACAKDGTC